MPNHCYQQVHIHGPRFLVKELYDHLTKADPEFCQVVVPMPFEQWLAPATKLMGYEVEGWYDWRVTNWGTKWDVCQVEITQPIECSGDIFGDNATASFSFNCWTAWSPPIPVWKKLHEMGISVDADYQDEGMMFEGRWVDGKDECWEPEIDLENNEEDA